MINRRTFITAAALSFASCTVKLNGVPMYTARAHVVRRPNCDTLELELKHIGNYVEHHRITFQSQSLLVSFVERLEARFCEEKGIPSRYIAVDAALHAATYAFPQPAKGQRS